MVYPITVILWDGKDYTLVYSDKIFLMSCPASDHKGYCQHFPFLLCAHLTNSLGEWCVLYCVLVTKAAVPLDTFCKMLLMFFLLKFYLGLSF